MRSVLRVKKKTPMNPRKKKKKHAPNASSRIWLIITFCCVFLQGFYPLRLQTAVHVGPCGARHVHCLVSVCCLHLYTWICVACLHHKFIEPGFPGLAIQALSGSCYYKSCCGVSSSKEKLLRQSAVLFFNKDAWFWPHPAPAAPQREIL